MSPRLAGSLASRVQVPTTSNRQPLHPRNDSTCSFASSVWTLLLTVLSLLPPAAVTGCWAQSYRVTHHLIRYGGATEWGLTDGRGRIMFEHLLLLDVPGPWAAGWQYRERSPAIDLLRRAYPNPTRWNELTGFGWSHYTFGAIRHWQLTVPYWFALSLTLLVPATRGWRHLRRRRQTALRRSRSQCIHCGYDLRASPNRCPECGKPS